jgi:serine/threonine protein phosphatase 1
VSQRYAEAGLLASRRLAREDICLMGPTVVFGHMPFETPLVMADRIGIDTGAVYGNFLTAVELPERVFYHA